MTRTPPPTDTAGARPPATARAPRRSKRRGADTGPAPTREVNYRQLRNPFPPMKVFSDDHITTIHEAALDLLETHGMRVLLPEARRLFRQGGATVDDPAEHVRIGREIVTAALATAPTSIACRAGARARDLVLEPGALVFQPGAGCPHATDLTRGRRPGSNRDFRELICLTQHFDALHMLPPLVEPQDIAPNLRHYATLDAQLTLSDKLPFIFARGTPQISQSLEMLQAFRGLDDAAFAAHSHCYTIINTNSPRTLDIPMAQGLIDFARAGQVAIVTPFTLMGAMAPITVAGAITLSHAEALAAITLTQLARPGAPVCYGTFTSNVDMKSGAPALGTPEHFRASLAAGQLARLIGLPWRSAGGSAANLSDVQAATESQFGLWGCLMAGATVIIHAAGWLEGGLTLSYEKLITDMESVQMVADLCQMGSENPADLALDALAEVQPGGHFFGTPHTLERYKTAFYQPLVADYANYGTWVERGGIDATTRATGIWQEILADFTPPKTDPDRVSDLNQSISRLTQAGGAAPVS